MASKVEYLARKLANTTKGLTLVIEAVRELQKAVEAENLSGPEEEYYRNAALRQFDGDDEVDIDANAIVSIPSDGEQDYGAGAWVAAWVWIEGHDEKEEKD